ncbi:hypothetical protein [Acetobacter orientalis]|uniref:hypothetical protein n=1 Tax=Acetobacter orientalis TaxID=146474 RepID=UPI0039E8FDD8
MPKADALSNTHRRAVLTGIIAAPFLAPANSVAQSTPINPDAKLLATYRQFKACRVQIDNHYGQESHPFGTPEQQREEEAFNSLVLKQESLAQALAGFSASTLQGYRAKAAAALTLLRDQVPDGTEQEEGPTTFLTISTLLDLAHGAHA